MTANSAIISKILLISNVIIVEIFHYIKINRGIYPQKEEKMLKDRIKQIKDLLNVSSKELADAINIPLHQLKDIERGKTASLKPQYAEKIEEIFHINGWWLLTGKGEMLKNQNNVNNSNICANNSCYNIDILSLKASAGSGIQNFEIETIGSIQLPKTLFKTPQNQDHLKLIEVQGDSMEPTIKDGTYLIINTNQSNLIDGGIYAIILDDQILIKRLQKTPNGIKIISDNPKYTPIEYNPKETNINFKILGKKILQIST